MGRSGLSYPAAQIGYGVAQPGLRDTGVGQTQVQREFGVANERFCVGRDFQRPGFPYRGNSPAGDASGRQSLPDQLNRVDYLVARLDFVREGALHALDLDGRIVKGTPEPGAGAARVVVDLAQTAASGSTVTPPILCGDIRAAPSH